MLFITYIYRLLFMAYFSGMIEKVKLTSLTSQEGKLPDYHYKYIVHVVFFLLLTRVELHFVDLTEFVDRVS